MTNIWKLQENTAALCKMAAKLSGYVVRGSGYVQPGKLKRLSSPIRRQASDAKYPDEVSDVKYPNGMAAEKIPDVRHPGGMAARSPIRTPLGRSTRHSRSSYPDDSISYPDMLFRMKKTACHSPRSPAFRWCVRTPCPDIFCHGFQITLLNLGLLWWSKSYQNTKT